jgi:hypothetical protein
VDVRKAIKTEDGGVVFEGELSPDEFDYVLGVGLNYLYEQGVLPFKAVSPEELMHYTDGSDVEQ